MTARGRVVRARAPHGPPKQRGWRRRLRELERWAAAHRHLDVEALDPAGTDYASAEVWFTRWPRPFPPTVRRHVVRHLVAIHDAWWPALQRTGRPFYLGLWLFEPDLGESQVVAAFGVRAAEYAARHAPPSAGSTPPAHLADAEARARLVWTRHPWTTEEPLADYPRRDWPAILRAATARKGSGAETRLTVARCDWFAVRRDGAVPAATVR